MSSGFRCLSVLDRPIAMSSDAMFMWELGGVIPYWSEGAPSLYRFSLDDVVNKSPHQVLRTTMPQLAEESERCLR